MRHGDYSFVTSTPLNKISESSGRFIDKYCSLPSPITSEVDCPRTPLNSLKSRENYSNKKNVCNTNMVKQPSSDHVIKNNFLIDNNVDETIFISDDEDPKEEMVPLKDVVSTVDVEVVNSLGEKFRKSLGGIGKEKSIKHHEDHANFDNRTNFKFGKVLENNFLFSHKNFNNKPLIGSTVNSNTKVLIPVRKNDDIARTLKRRSPPPTFNTPDRPKEKPMAAFRKMQRAGPMLCSPQPLIEKVIREPLKDKKDLKDMIPDIATSYVPKDKKTEEDIINEINAIGNVMTLNEIVVDTIVATSKLKRLIGGLMNENRINAIAVKLANLFKTLLKFTEDFNNTMEIETPKYFVKELTDYQKRGLAFLVEREKSYPCGGILADDMGLGKTAQMISLIVYQKNSFKINQSLETLRQKKARENGLVPIKTTLIITPLSLMDQWESEIRKFTTSGFLTVYQFHGPKRTCDPHVLGQYDIVISSYNTIASEFTSIVNDEDEEGGRKLKKSNPIKKTNTRKVCKSSVLERVCFQRVILDEAHTIKNRNSKVSRACNALSSLYRWCVTGTPIHNEMMDGFSLYRFLRCYPVDQEAMWKQYMNSGSKEGPFRLKTLVKATLLRRTKDDKSKETGEKLVNLPKRNIEQVELEMTSGERLIYDQMFKAAQKFVRSFLDEFNGKDNDGNFYDNASDFKNPFLNANVSDYDGQFKKMACILVYLLRLRQACNHFFLTKAGLDLSCFDAIDEKSAEFMKVDTSIDQSMDDSIMNNKNCKDHLGVFKKEFLSSKIKALFERLNKVFNSTNDKVIIISQWTSMFSLIKQHLISRGISYVEITGEVSQEDRQKAQNAINSNSEKVRVMFLSLKAGGVGLNLVGANHIFMLDLHWNPFNEDQACDRIYRIGQTKEVFIHKFVCKNTVEKRVLDLQSKKRELSKEFLGETRSKKANHLNNADLAFIFDCQ